MRWSSSYSSSSNQRLSVAASSSIGIASTFWGACISTKNTTSAMLAIGDACYDRGSTFGLKWFLIDGITQPQIVRNGTFFTHDFRRKPRPWEFSSGSFFFLLQIRFWERS